jgi:hypothetical protein
MNKSLRGELQVLIRELIFRLDTTKYLLDNPTFDYQPLPWIGIMDAPIRGQSTHDRWAALKGSIPPDALTLKDIGCCVGFFCHKATEELHLFSLGIDSDARFIRIARYVAAKNIQLKNETFLEIQLNPENASIVPITDITILFSIWHHWVFDYGLESATKMLKEIWAKTNMTLYFESGEEEIEQEFKIDFHGNARAWLKNYLKTELENSRIEVIGEFEAGKYEHYKLKSHFRTLYAVKKIRA